MAFSLSPEQRQVADTARAFALEQMRPNAGQWEARGALDREILSVMAAIGFAGVCVRPDVGGSGLGRIDSVLVFEQLARGCIATTAFLSAHNTVAWMIDQFGHEQQRRLWVARLCTMEQAGSFCLAEPGVGSDAANLRTTAVRAGAEYILNGAKAFVSGAGFADVYLVMARTAGEGARGISCFLVPADAPGLRIGKLERKMGWRALPTAQITMEDCRIPAVNLIGKEGDGFLYAMQALDGSRLNIAACSLGGAAEAIERTLEYAREREQFGQFIANFQATQFKLADMATKLEAARLLVYDAARRLDARSSEATRHCAMAKKFATDCGFEIANEALQIHGGNGYLADFDIERIVRDLRAHQIVEGTNEIMRLIIARQMMGR